MQQIIANLESHISKGGGYWRDWYIGITSDVQQRLFADHCVRGIGDWWIHQPASSAEEARFIEKHFLGKGMDGGRGGGDHSTRHVYVYKKGNHTKP